MFTIEIALRSQRWTEEEKAGVLVRLSEQEHYTRVEEPIAISYVIEEWQSVFNEPDLFDRRVKEVSRIVGEQPEVALGAITFFAATLFPGFRPRQDRNGTSSMAFGQHISKGLTYIRLMNEGLSNMPNAVRAFQTTCQPFMALAIINKRTGDSASKLYAGGSEMKVARTLRELPGLCTLLAPLVSDKWVQLVTMSKG